MMDWQAKQPIPIDKINNYFPLADPVHCRKGSCRAARSRRLLTVRLQLVVILAAMLASICSIQPADAAATADTTFIGQFGKWQKVVVPFSGHCIDTSWTGPNPFSIQVTGRFKRPNGSVIESPGFYDGDGAGGQEGNVWKFHFAADTVGVWNLETVSTDTLLNGQHFQFSIGESGHPGRLQYVGKYYLKYSDGGYWYKTGSDDPEHFLGETVFGGWAGKAEQIDYLASKGINSLYMTFLDYPGDSGLVWPWLLPTRQDTFDIAKLKRWEEMFDYIQAKGIVLHLVWEDDGAQIPVDHAFFYRNLVARFSYLNSVIWNIREEFNEQYTPVQVQQFAALLKQIDPFDHPIALHNLNRPTGWFLSDPNFSMTSIQTLKPSKTYPPSEFNELVVEWRDSTRTRNRPIVISLDETGKIGASEADRLWARRMEWAIASGGGVFELHIYPSDNYQIFENHWNDILHLRNFMNRLPFWDMYPRNAIVSSNVFALAKNDQEMFVYTPYDTSFALDLTSFDTLMIGDWYHPVEGRTIGRSLAQAGAEIQFQSPTGSDAVLHLRQALAFRVRAWLQGAHQQNGTMRQARSIPLTSPYSTQVPAMVAAMPDSAVDWMLLELRQNSAGPPQLQASVLLSRNGFILDPETLSPILVAPDLAPGSYYIVLQHRNHLAVMGAQSISLSYTQVAPYDFTSGLAQYHQNSGAVELGNARWAIACGDADQNQAVDTADFDLWAASAKQDSQGYVVADFNFDGYVTTQDYRLWYLNWQDAQGSVVP